jgi:hypothetical protein
MFISVQLCPHDSYRDSVVLCDSSSLLPHRKSPAEAGQALPKGEGLKLLTY